MSTAQRRKRKPALAHRPARSQPQPSAAGLLEQGLAAHQAGNPALAEARYRAVLRLAPEQPDALHLLGVVALQQGRLAEADALIHAALARTPEQPTFWNSLGVLQRARGQLQDSATSFSRAVELAPAYVDGWSNLVSAREALGDRAGEAAALTRLLTLLPAHARGWARLGVLAADDGRFDEAAALLERATALAPDFAEAWSSLGSIQLRLDRLDAAEASQRRANALRPDDPTILNNLGGVLVTRGCWQEAVDVLTRVTTLAPTDENGWFNLGYALNGLERWGEAVAAFERGLALQPASAVALVSLGDALSGLRRLDEAVRCYERAVALQPNDAATYERLGIALQALGRLADAVTAYRQSLALAPDRPDLHSALIFALDLLEDAEAEARQERARWNARFGRPADAGAPHPNDRTPDRPLRIGYVSADFLNHSAGLATLPVVQAHGRSRVSVVCYSGVTRPDAVTARFQAASDLWRDVAPLSDDALAELIRADRIDLLVDLSGHSAGNRLPVFARRPAPVQVTAWGYAAGTGLTAMEYFLADPIVVPAEAHDAYSEEVVHLPTLMCYAPPPVVPEIAPPPALTRGHITFGAFNRLVKVSPGTVAAWAQVLTAVPTARLIVKAGSQSSDGARQRLLADLEALGVSPERVEMRGGTSQFDHLAAHADVDLMLDTFPQAGGITTIEALLMGVPAVTLLGERVSGRTTATFLAAVGLDDLIARTPAEYVALAVRLAGDLPRLAHERATLRDRLLASPVGDTARFTRALEDTYRALWRRWCRDQEPALSHQLSAISRQESGVDNESLAREGLVS